MQAVIAVLPGDGIGPEVTAEAVRVLRAVATRFGHEFRFREHPIGGAALDATGSPLPVATREHCCAADAVLLGAVGGPRWDDNPPHLRPERGLLDLRQAMGLYANIRPVRPLPIAATLSPIKRKVLRGVDIVVVRELTGGIYFGAKTCDDLSASDECRYTVSEIERIARVAFRLAAARRGRLASVDKANVLATSRLWRRTVERLGREEFPHITLEHVLVDTAAMRLIQRPADFDVIVTENMFGDILTDEAAVLAGSIGLLGSASLAGDETGRTRGLYEPVHGSAPDIAGRGIASPVGAILSAAMLLRHSLGLCTEAAAVERAVATCPLLDHDGTGAVPVATTAETGAAIIGALPRQKMTVVP